MNAVPVRGYLRVMRAPIRSESDAFRLALLGAAAIVVCLVVGVLIAPLAGVVLFAVVLAVALVAYLRAPDPDRRRRLREAAHAPHPHAADPGTRHVLVVANEALAGGELRERIVGSDGERVEIDVLAPVLTSHVHLGVTDVDRETRAAQRRLERSLAWARAQRIRARGSVGRTSPVLAIEDELRDFGADEVIVVTHPRERETWQERGELERLREELDVPVTHVVVGDGGA
jgi:GABA permease